MQDTFFLEGSMALYLNSYRVFFYFKYFDEIIFFSTAGFVEPGVLGGGHSYA